MGQISKVTVSLNNAKHAYASDLSALLVYKATNNVSGSVVLMSAAGGASELNGVNITFDDAGACCARVHSDWGWAVQADRLCRRRSFLALRRQTLPTAPSLTNAFQGKYPNGKWSLYAYDAAPVTAGQIGSWTVECVDLP